jgi:hypothetical protein
MNDRGSSFNERTCIMTITRHNVAAPSPEAFAGRKTSPFCGAPAYGRESFPFPNQGLLPSVRKVCALLRDSTLQTLEFFDRLRSCFYPNERFSLEPANMIQLSSVLLMSSFAGGKKWKCTPPMRHERTRIHPPDESGGFLLGSCKSS